LENPPVPGLGVQVALMSGWGETYRRSRQITPRRTSREYQADKRTQGSVHRASRARLARTFYWRVGGNDLVLYPDFVYDRPQVILPSNFTSTTLPRRDINDTYLLPRCLSPRRLLGMGSRRNSPSSAERSNSAHHILERRA
jgi:hypothetical protein